jgi:hypothetical protein
VAAGISARLSRAEARKFGLLVGAAFVVLGLVLAWRGRQAPALISSSVGALLFLLGALFPDVLGPVYRAWMGLSGLISKVTTPIFMAVVYFGVLTPVGLIRRATGHNPLKRAPATDGSLWIQRDRRRADPKGLEHQF